MNNLITYLSVYSVLIPLLVGLILFLKLNTVAKTMLLLLGFATVAQFSKALFVKPNLVAAAYNIYLIIENLFTAFLFYYSIKNKARTLVVILFLIFCFTYLYVVTTIGINQRFINELQCFNCLIQVTWVSVYFYNLFKYDNLFKIEQKPMFWFCMAILIYAPCTYFLFAFKNQIEVTELLKPFWNIHGILNTIYYIVISIGFFVTYKTTKIIL